MDSPLPEPTATSDWRRSIADSLDDQRQRARDVLAQQREKFRALEQNLADRAQALIDALAADEQTIAARSADADGQEKVLQERDSFLAQQRAQLETREAEWTAAQREALASQQSYFDQLTRRLTLLDERQAACDTLETKLALRQAECDNRESELKRLADEAAQRSEHAERQLEQLADRVEQLDEQTAVSRRSQAQLDQQREALAQRELETEKQRRHIAQQLRARKKELVAEVELHRAEALCSSHGEELQLQIRLSEVQARCDRLQDELDRRETLHDSAADSVVDLRQRCEALQAANAQLEQALADAPASAAASDHDDSQALADLRRRYELATQDIRDLKIKNNDLNEQLVRAKRAAPAAAPAAVGMGWEAQKQRLLQQLEEDSDGSDEAQRKDRLAIESVIRSTDKIIAEKEQELEELRHLLAQQSQNIGNVAVGAAAIAGLFDSDELIRQERENVRQQQAELDGKLCQAEIDISLERAKLARERSVLEEKLQALEKERAQLTAAYGEGGGDATQRGQKTPPRGRWLARLGLGDGDTSK